MTTYKQIFGKQIKVLSTDPTDAGAEGQVWYNSTSGTFKTVLGVGAWSAGGTVPYTSRQNMSFGTQDAAINVGGYVTATLSTAASYDGASWTASPSLNVAARMGGVAGTQTAGLQFGGIQPPGTYNTNMQTWNGSAWADSPLNLTTGTYGLMGCGTQTAALKVGGENPAGGNYTTSEEFDGSGWTAGGALPEAKYVGAGNGVQTSALITGGSPSGTTTFEYNGSSWTAGGALSTSRPGTQAGSAGVSSSSNIIFGGNAPGGVISATEGYDGTSWSTRPSLATGRGSTTGNGTESAGLMVSGGPPSSTTTLTEEYSLSIYSPVAATWASGGALSTGRESMSSAGTQTAALAVGGRVGPPGASTAVESYNGTSMSGAPSLNTARQYAGGCGTQTAAITYGNFPVSGATEEYDGSSWATQPNSMSTARRAFASFGIQTAALAAGGTTGPAVQTLTEEYNGTSWTAGGALSTARQYFAGAGIETSGLVFGGSDNPNSTKYANTEEYGGTSWTAGGALPTGTSGLMGCGATQTAALAFGGYQPSKVATTVGYDGTAWSSRPAMGGATAEGSGAGTNVAGLSIGGSPAETGVEEFTGEIVQLGYKTLTSS